MTHIEELIQVADRLCLSLEKAAHEEKKFCHDICFALERYNWEMYCLTNDIRKIKTLANQVKRTKETI